jgi:O-acetylhomoserine (thiol)-lyase
LGGFDSGFISARRTPVVAPAKAPRNGGLFKTMNAETLAVHAGTRPDAASGARNMPIYQTTAYTFDDSDHAESLFNLQEPGNVYGRMSNPTTAALEQRLAALDNAVGACCVSSGHAAQLMALYPLMSSGKKLVASSNLYGGSITQFSKAFKSFGWDAELVDVSNFTEVSRAVSDPNVVGLFIESLANPDGNVSDLEKLADIAHEAGVPLIVDNTMATPILCQPGGFGADLVVYSTTKFLSGHGNAMGGAVVDTGKFDWLKGRDFPCLNSPDEAYHGITFTETFGPLAFITFCHARILRDLGSTMSPFNAYLTLLGLETLPLRMVKHMTNAEAIARFLVSHKKVKSVSWAGLDTSPYYDLSQKYMQKGSGSVFTFSIAGRAKDALKVIDSCNLFSHVSNIGDTRSLINHPASTTHRQLSAEQLVACGLSDTTIRVSIGIENEADLINDLEGALDTI